MACSLHASVLLVPTLHGGLGLGLGGLLYRGDIRGCHVYGIVAEQGRSVSVYASNACPPSQVRPMGRRAERGGSVSAPGLWLEGRGCSMLTVMPSGDLAIATRV